MESGIEGRESGIRNRISRGYVRGQKGIIESNLPTQPVPRPLLSRSGLTSSGIGGSGTTSGMGSDVSSLGMGGAPTYKIISSSHTPITKLPVWVLIALTVTSTLLLSCCTGMVLFFNFKPVATPYTHNPHTPYTPVYTGMENDIPYPTHYQQDDYPTPYTGKIHTGIRKKSKLSSASTHTSLPLHVEGVEIKVDEFGRRYYEQGRVYLPILHVFDPFFRFFLGIGDGIAHTLTGILGGWWRKSNPHTSTPHTSTPSTSTAEFIF